MDCKKCSGLKEILRKSISLLSKNRKLMASITILCIILSYLLFLLKTFIIKSLFPDLVFKWLQQYLLTAINKSPAPQGISNHQTSDEDVKKDFGLLMLVQLVFFLASFINSALFSSAIIFVSATSYSNNKTLSIKDVLVNVAKSWKRVFVTYFYTTLLALSYFFLFIIIVIIIWVPMSLILYDNYLLIIALLIVISSVATIFFLYVSVSWSLALVITVTEENCYGTKALGRAGELVKGNRLHGFVINFLFNLLAFIVFQGSEMAKQKQSSLAISQMIVELLRTSSMRLLVMLLFVAYTVLYFQCKESHGEDTELLQQGGFEYSKLPTESNNVSIDIQ